MLWLHPWTQGKAVDSFGMEVTDKRTPKTKVSSNDVAPISNLEKDLINQDDLLLIDKSSSKLFQPFLAKPITPYGNQDSYNENIRSKNDVITYLKLESNEGNPPIMADELTGTWKCRSVQASDLGIFGYPFMKCRIKYLEHALRFDKLNGSQLKGGMLYKNEKGFAFLGGWHTPYVDVPSKTYSGIPKDPSQRFDSVGQFYFSRGRENTIGLAIFPSDDKSVELYWLERTTPRK